MNVVSLVHLILVYKGMLSLIETLPLGKKGKNQDPLHSHVFTRDHKIAIPPLNDRQGRRKVILYRQNAREKSTV